MIRFLDPRVRESVRAYEPIRWASDSFEILPPAEALATAVDRRSIRELTLPTLTALSTVLWHTMRTQETFASPLGFEIQLRPLPSAGAIHPIHILLEHPTTKKWSRYDPQRHGLMQLVDAQVLDELRMLANDYLSVGQASMIAFAAESGMTAAKYENPESLVWRDAGIVQGALSLTAPGAALGMCLLGLTGDCSIAKLGEQGQLRGVGTAIIGALP